MNTDEPKFSNSMYIPKEVEREKNDSKLSISMVVDSNPKHEEVPYVADPKGLVLPEELKN